MRLAPDWDGSWCLYANMLQDVGHSKSERDQEFETLAKWLQVFTKQRSLTHPWFVDLRISSRLWVIVVIFAQCRTPGVTPTAWHSPVRDTVVRSDRCFLAISSSENCLISQRLAFQTLCLCTNDYKWPALELRSPKTLPKSKGVDAKCICNSDHKGISCLSKFILEKACQTLAAGANFPNPKAFPSAPRQHESGQQRYSWFPEGPLNELCHLE